MVEARRGPKTTWGPKPGNAIQFKVALKYIRPPIYRRVVMPDTFTLGQLHEVIQVTMGWYNCHMHSFRIGGVCYTGGDAAGMEDMDMENEETVRLSQVISGPKQKFVYEYDFGDSWMHEITVEKLLPFDPKARYPLCLAGARACPPEDCGSFPGYDAILEALTAKNKTEAQKELLEWLEGGYDPEAFDLNAVNRRLAGRE